jgi:hypothetical protein
MELQGDLIHFDNQKKGRKQLENSIQLLGWRCEERRLKQLEKQKNKGPERKRQETVQQK